MPIVFATDSGVFPHGLNARQFPIMVARGMTPMQAIRVRHHAWPRTTWAGREDVGTIEPDKFGDIIAVKGDPLQDIRVLQNVAVVVKGGMLFKMTMAEYDAQSSKYCSYSRRHRRNRADLDVPVEHLRRLALDLQLAAGHGHSLVAVLVARILSAP